MNERRQVFGTAELCKAANLLTRKLAGDAVELTGDAALLEQILFAPAVPTETWDRLAAILIGRLHDADTRDVLRDSYLHVVGVKLAEEHGISEADGRRLALVKLAGIVENEKRAERARAIEETTA